MALQKQMRPGPDVLQAVTVIGAGHRGRAFAFRCLEAGFSVVLEDVLSSRLRRAEEQVAQQQPHLLERLRLAASVEEAVREADVVIDFVPDELESKLEIFSLVDRMAPPRTIMLTPTTLSITDLASCTYRAERCLAVTPFGDQLGHRVQVVKGAASSDDVLQAVRVWFEALGSQVDIVPDAAPGMLVRS